jgi:hypothetical protein
LLKTLASKTSVESLAKFTWRILDGVLERASETELPPIYFFLAPWSKGSLRGRQTAEIELVHRQQLYRQGVALIDPPAAWVSDISQIPEEAAHLYAIVHQSKAPKKMTEEHELRWMLLHETFGKFGNYLTLGNWKPQKKRNFSVNNYSDLWSLSHLEGYFLGQKLAEAYVAEKISKEEIQKWFAFNWSSEKQSFTALKFLYKLLNESPPLPNLV